METAEHGRTMAALERENTALRLQLDEAEETLHAIRRGEVDGLVVHGEDGVQVFVPQGVDRSYRLLVENMSEGALTVDAGGLVLYANRQAAALCKAPLEQLIGSMVDDWISPEDRPTLRTLLRSDTGSVGRVELELVAADGECAPMLVSGSVDSTDPQARFCLVLTDLRGQRRAEAMVASERMARLILEQAAEAIVVCDEQGQVVRANRAAQSLCDGSPLQRPFYEAFPLRTDAPDPFHVRLVLQGETQPNLTVALDRHGQTFDLVLNAGPLKRGQEILGCVITLTDVTERKQAEEALREREQRLRYLLTSTPAVIYTCRPSGDFGATFVSENVQQLLGFQASEFVADSSFRANHVHPEDSERVFTGLTAVSTQDLLVHEYRFRDQAGAYRWMHDEVRLLRDADGQPVELIGYWTDITERKRSQDRNQFARELLELLNCEGTGLHKIRDILHLIRTSTGMEAVGIRLQDGDDFPYLETGGFPDHFVQKERYLCARDEKGKILRDKEGNPILECMCGNVLRCRTDPTLPFFTEGGSFWSNCTTELLASTTEEDLQAHTRNQCNSEGYESVALIPLWSENEIIGLLQLNDRRRDQFDAEMIQFFEGMGASIGIALARIRVDETLRESEARLQDIVSCVVERVWEVDERGVYTYCSGKSYEMFGLSREEVIGKTPFDFMPPDEAHRVGSIFSDIVARKAPIEDLENLNVRKNGETIILLTNGVPILDESGHLMGYRGADKDITERKHADVRRHDLEEQLRASQKMEAIGSLAGGVAHDFNNLLSVILSYTGFVMDAIPDGDPLRSDLVEVQNAADRAAVLTRQLLAFGRKQVLQPVSLNLNEIAVGVEKMLRRILGEDIEFVQVLSTDLGLTLADPGQIEQVLMNLVVNARDAMPRGGKLTIETSNVEIDEEYATCHVAVTPGPYVQLAVTDTGCGMDAQIKARLFEPFFTTKEEGKGTGLGLAMVYGIVKQSGGSVWVYSELGEGTTFKIYLPRESSATTAAIKPATIPTTFKGTETILVVEDEEALRKIAKRSLEAVGYRVLTASDGEEALLASTQYTGDIHLLLTDVVMPRMGGRVLAQELSKTRPSTKVVYMSGYTDDTISHHGILDPGTHFLAKPFTSTAVKQKVREVLDDSMPLSPR